MAVRSRRLTRRHRTLLARESANDVIAPRRCVLAWKKYALLERQRVGTAKRAAIPSFVGLETITLKPVAIFSRPSGSEPRPRLNATAAASPDRS